ncbi:MAG: hypothetical protein V1895_01460 [Parcubacteria group bacterium]
MTNLATVFFLLSGLAAVLLIIGLIQPRAFAKLFKGRATRGRAGLLFGSAALFLFVVFLFLGIRGTAGDDTQGTSIDSEVAGDTANSNEIPSNEPAKEPELPQYEVLKHEETGGTERWINVALFAESQDQELLKQMAFKYRREKCDIQCNIEIWDNREAFDASQKYDQLVSEWKFDEADIVKCDTEVLRENHLVGYTTLFTPDEWDPYPIKDDERDPLCT